MFEKKLQGIEDLALISHVGKAELVPIVEQRCSDERLHQGCVSDCNQTREREVFANRKGCSEPFTGNPCEPEDDRQ